MKLMWVFYRRTFGRFRFEAGAHLRCWALGIWWDGFGWPWGFVLWVGPLFALLANPEPQTHNAE